LPFGERREGRRAETTWELPDSAARWRGDAPSVSQREGSAPRERRREAALAWPLAAAKWRGVSPVSALAFGEREWEPTRAARTRSEPQAAATWRGVVAEEKRASAEGERRAGEGRPGSLEGELGGE